MSSQLPHEEEIAAVRSRRAHSVKWQRYPDDVLPAWVADMDFPPPARAIQAGISLLENGDTGYPSSDLTAEYEEAYRSWAKASFGTEPNPLHTVADVVAGLKIIVSSVTEAGSGVIVLTPSYPPFFQVVKSAQRNLVPVELRRVGLHYSVDLDLLAQTAARPDVQALILCNPHNPTGRGFTREELTEIAEIAQRHRLVVIADEIHQDLRGPDTTHIPFSSLDVASAGQAVVLSSPSKSFNIAGLKVAHIEVPVDDALRERILANPQLGLSQATAIGLTVGAQAYRSEREWLDATCAIIDHNFSLVEKGLGESEKLRLTARQGTYLLWAEVVGHTTQSAYQLLLDRAHVAVGPGEDYLPGAPEFFRLNLAAWPSTVETMIERIRYALDTI